MGFDEIEHTADCSIRVWAPDLPSMFAEAARGLNCIAGARLGNGHRLGRKLSLRGADDESLLVSFLTEMLIAQEQESLGFDEFDLRITPGRLSGSVRGAALESLEKPIKAVTFHGLRIEKTAQGCEAEIVFDV
jgi:SHS2 domain-containing protein